MESTWKSLKYGWVKSLQCKARAVDVVESHHLHLLPASSSCRKSFQSLKDVVDTTKQKPRKPKPSQPSPPPELPPSRKTKSSVSRKPENVTRVRSSNSLSSNSRRHSRPSDSYFPALTDLPEGHPSRNVVEIIFHTSWSPKVFSGRIEMVFKVQNLARTVSRFEEYREVVKSGSGSSDNGGSGLGEDHARCVADGNEVMRFQCLGPTGGGAYETAGGGAWSFQWGKGAALCTFSGSGVAHERAGGGRGRKAMLVCRVIAGRVHKQLEFDSVYNGRVGYDSVSGGNGELLVFDSRAVLPCFLIIYKL
ncbi:hypothetical protein Ccrd_002422 [Cynara cardunculus var. scolymus]|uniref:Poly(ADP-ribose) polymerase, catalytic domain-containing protein n=1 Tax=Cynara cardunculus var. scolymus TaxID=59895 RepID=A0A118JX63_CYNCS|nr:hypothetical protein Ccrd_002422 [Cynara cardunculus var. scolymus]